jgi:enoyl-[acyl-carrier-protein] reductase (NADH)
MRRPSPPGLPAHPRAGHQRTAPLVAARAAAQGEDPHTAEARMAAGNSIRHLVDAAEVADVVVFLCSPQSRAINGDAIAVGGGAPHSIHC